MINSFQSITANQIEHFRWRDSRYIQFVAQLSRGNFEGQYAGVEHQEMTYIRRQTDQTIAESGIMPDDYVGIGFYPEESSFYLKGRYYGKGGIIVADAGQHWDGVTLKGCTHYSVIFRKDNIKKYFNEQQQAIWQKLFAGEYDIASADLDFQYAIFRSIDRAIKYLEQQVVSLNDERFFSDCRDDIMYFIAKVIDSVATDNLRMNSNARLLDKALDLINKRLHESVRVAEVANELHTNRRNLELAFNYYLGITPKEYINNMRLNLIRHDLVSNAMEEPSISQIAKQHGIKHLGNFSRAYATLFEELPTETLRRQRQALLQQVTPA